MQANPALDNIKPKAMLVVENLHIWYGSKHAVDNLSCEIEAGEIYGLLGPNGAGKTSTLSAIEGLIRPQSGHIQIAGYDTQTKRLEAKASVGIQLQATSFQPDLTLSEILK